MGRFLLIILVSLAMGGCAGDLAVDNTASGGGKAGLFWRRCDPVAPIGGGTGAVDVTERIGGTVVK